MQLQPLFPLSYIQPSNNFDTDNYPDIRPWVKNAIAEEEQKPNGQLWKKEPSAEFQYNERLRRIRFLRKREKNDASSKQFADRLELCDRNSRCCSGACPECGRLLQRWFVRKSKNLIRDVVDKADHQLVAITIIPSKPIIRPGKLHTLDIQNLRRRLLYALDKADIEVAIGAIDFSFNEDKEGNYDPFWCAHYYVITSVANQARVKQTLKQFFSSSRRIPRPIKISQFTNSRQRMSYAFKTQFNRRMGFDTVMNRNDGMTRKCRNTSRDKLRAAERLELFMYLDRIGFSERFIFCGVKPIIESTKVKLRAI
jgi:hypothetical protein